MICKGRACALHLTKEYEEGKRAALEDLAGTITSNPYNFFDEYENHYAWCIGYQTKQLADHIDNMIINGE